MAYSAPAFKYELLFPSKEGISGKSSDSILPLLNLCVVLPGTDCNSQSIVIYFLLEESIQTAFLLSLLVFEFFYRWILGFNLLRHLSDFVVFSRGVLIQVGLILNHVTVTHVHIFLNQFVLEILVKSVEDNWESLNCSRSIPNWHCRRNLGNFAKLGHFGPSRKIAHLSRFYCKHIILVGLTLSEFPEIAFDILTHNVVMFANCTCWGGWVLRLFGLLANRLLIWSLRM